MDIHRFSLYDSNTLTTVGYGEIHPVSHVELRIFTILLVLLGFGVVTYTFGTITAYMVEGDLKHSLRRRKMLNKIKKMSDHIKKIRQLVA